MGLSPNNLLFSLRVGSQKGLPIGWIKAFHRILIGE